jgi:hypothetical protein
MINTDFIDGIGQRNAPALGGSDRADLRRQGAEMSGTGSARGTRVNSLDWLRVLALLGVFVYHTLRPFDTTYWHVKSVHRSQLLTDVLAVIGSWGLAFFFLIAGGQYVPRTPLADPGGVRPGAPTPPRRTTRGRLGRR